MSRQVPLVIYHGNCADGFTSAWIIHEIYPDWEFFAATHGNPPPDVRGRTVMMVDFSFKRHVLLDMMKVAKSITIIDHHESAQKELQALDGVSMEDSDYCDVELVFDMSKSGAMLTWEFFNPKSVYPHVPTFIQYVQDRDLWKFEMEHSREVASAIFSYEYTWDNWTSLSRICESPTQFQHLVAEGFAIERKHYKDILELLQVFTMYKNVAGIHVPLANLPYTMSSDAGHMMAKDAPFACCFYETPNGIEFSLRSRPGGLNVSEVAKTYGGGGHAHAAGFRLLKGQTLADYDITKASVYPFPSAE